MRKHRPAYGRDAILHTFDPESRTLRITFVSPEGKLLGVTYRLCPRCGVTMEETASEDGACCACALCGSKT